MNSSLAFSDTGLKYKKFKVNIFSKDIKALILLFKKKIKVLKFVIILYICLTLARSNWRTLALTSFASAAVLSTMLAAT